MAERILPSLTEISADSNTSSDGALARGLSTLFEPSPVLYSDIVPAVHNILLNPVTRSSPLTYNALIDLTTHILSTSPSTLQACFISAHPRIGEITGLSALSANEQAARATPTEVLARLAILNAAYERRFEGLRYITFVNGRSRAEIMEEMEQFLGVGKGDVELDKIRVEDVGGGVWTEEVKRAVRDVGKIAKRRLTALGVDGSAVLNS